MKVRKLAKLHARLSLRRWSSAKIALQEFESYIRDAQEKMVGAFYMKQFAICFQGRKIQGDAAVFRRGGNHA